MSFDMNTLQYLAGKFIDLTNSKMGYPIRKIYHGLYSALGNSYTVADVEGRKMYLNRIDAIQNRISCLGEPFETEIIRRFTEKGDRVVDLGAGVGYYMTLYAELVGTNGEVYAFEPEPRNHRCIQKTLELNGYENVILEQKAVCDTNGTCDLYVSKRDSTTHRIYTKRGDRESVTVDSVRLDDYFSGRPVDFIKMDVEGAEHSALLGAKGLIERSENVVLVTEFSPQALHNYGVEPSNFLELVNDLQFDIFNINEETEQLEEVRDCSLEGQLNPLGYTNLLCIQS